MRPKVYLILKNVLILLILIIQGIWLCNTSIEQLCGLCIDNKCKSCYDSFLDDDQCKKPKTIIPFCEFYFDEDYCLDCKLGYELSEDHKKCELSQEHGCLKSYSGLCINCDGHLLDLSSHECVSSKECSIEGCRSCSYVYFTETCDLCEDDYIAYIKTEHVQTICKKRDNSHVGCAALYNDKCYYCEYGYIDVQNTEHEVQCKKSNFNTPHIIDKAFVHFNRANGNDGFCTKCFNHSCEECHLTYPRFNSNCLQPNKLIFACEIY